MSDSDALVVGFAPDGHFRGAIPHGFTHGYWTQNMFPSGNPVDGAGHDEDYVARILMEFDLDNAGVVTADRLESAVLTLYYYMSHTVSGGTGALTFDVHRMHPGTTHGVTNSPFTENATWWEFDHTGGATYDGDLAWSALPYNGFSGATGNFNYTNKHGHGISFGENAWDAQGLGMTGGTAEHSADPEHALGQWYDYSGGPAGSNQNAYADNLYNYNFTASKSSIVAGDKLELDIIDAVQDAMDNYDNKLRIMIKLREDTGYDGSKHEAFIAFHSSEAEGYRLDILSPVETGKAKYTPSIHLVYFDDAL